MKSTITFVFLTIYYLSCYSQSSNTNIQAIKANDHPKTTILNKLHIGFDNEYSINKYLIKDAYFFQFNRKKKISELDQIFSKIEKSHQEVQVKILKDLTRYYQQVGKLNEYYYYTTNKLTEILGNSTDTIVTEHQMLSLIGLTDSFKIQSSIALNNIKILSFKIESIIGCPLKIDPDTSEYSIYEIQSELKSITMKGMYRILKYNNLLSDLGVLNPNKANLNNDSIQLMNSYESIVLKLDNLFFQLQHQYQYHIKAIVIEQTPVEYSLVNYNQIRKLINRNQILYNQQLEYLKLVQQYNSNVFWLEMYY